MPARKPRFFWLHQYKDMGQAVSAPDKNDWWTLERDTKATNAVTKFVKDVVNSTKEDEVDFVATAYNGRTFIVLVGETHVESSWDPVNALDELDAAIDARATRYTEALATYDKSIHQDTLCSEQNALSARVCRTGGSRRIDPRTPVLYEFLSNIKTQDPIKNLKYQLQLYTDIMTLYFNAVRATVKAIIVRRQKRRIPRCSRHS